MTNNYIIRTIDKKQYFGGWKSFGEISMKSEDQKEFSNRMPKTVALKTLSKIEAYTKKKCEIINCNTYE